MLPTSYTFQYRLVGTTEWSSSVTSNLTTALFDDLDPGQYEVRARVNYPLGSSNWTQINTSCLNRAIDLPCQNLHLFRNKPFSFIFNHYDSAGNLVDLNISLLEAKIFYVSDNVHYSQFTVNKISTGYLAPAIQLSLTVPFVAAIPLVDQDNPSSYYEVTYNGNLLLYGALFVCN